MNDHSILSFSGPACSALQHSTSELLLRVVQLLSSWGLRGAGHTSRHCTTASCVTLAVLYMVGQPPLLSPPRSYTICMGASPPHWCAIHVCSSHLSSLAAPCCALPQRPGQNIEGSFSLLESKYTKIYGLVLITYSFQLDSEKFLYVCSACH